MTLCISVGLLCVKFGFALHNLDNIPIASGTDQALDMCIHHLIVPLPHRLIEGKNYRLASKKGNKLGGVCLLSCTHAVNG